MWIGTAPFSSVGPHPRNSDGSSGAPRSGVNPEARYEWRDGNTHVQFDGPVAFHSLKHGMSPMDAKADAEIVLLGHHRLEASDFILWRSGGWKPSPAWRTTKPAASPSGAWSKQPLSPTQRLRRAHHRRLSDEEVVMGLRDMLVGGVRVGPDDVIDIGAARATTTLREIAGLMLDELAARGVPIPPAPEKPKSEPSAPEPASELDQMSA
jgi:hypothetical protein